VFQRTSESNAGSVLDWPPAGVIDSAESYARYADVYDALFDDLDADAQFYVAEANARVGARQQLLEIGVGTGRLTARLLRNAHRVVGLDASTEMLSRALSKFGSDDRVELIAGDIRTLALGGTTFPLVIAPYGMVAHLLTDDDRLAAFRSIYAHLAPGGAFVFDDCPSWLAAADDGTALHVVRIRADPSGTGTVRLMTNTVDAAGAPVSVRYDFIDRLDADGRVVKRTIVRIVFRNISLDAELRLLARAGFARIDVLGGFDGRPLDVARPGADARLILRCHRDA
jgi:SAM-dependent methyltransferase